MNILFFLKPKNDLTYIYENYSIRQALEKMEHYRYTSIPVLSKKGEYVSTITEGDILWYLKENNISFEETNKFPIKNIQRYREYQAIGINKEITDLIDLIKNQNYVPVIDDRNMFIGIITRKDVIQYLYENRK